VKNSPKSQKSPVTEELRASKNSSSKIDRAAVLGIDKAG
jgi:hypothetical protein